VIDKAYAHKTYYLMATDSSHPPGAGRVVGILPLVYLKSFLLGNNSLISIPFFDLGGIIADNEAVEKAIFSQALELARGLGVNNIELRNIHPTSWLNAPDESYGRTLDHLTEIIYFCRTRSHKVRMVLELPESAEVLMKSFKSKLRSQINVPVKEGLQSKIGGIELLEDFYKVFLVNMRDLGSPVHSKKILREVMEEFSGSARIIMVYKDDRALAGSIVIGFRDTLENPWASSLKAYSKLSPNMLLYWTMLKYASDNGYRYFDFGRSSPNEGTYRFKEQWGARPTVLNWHYVFLNNRPDGDGITDKSRFEAAIRYWRKLPVGVTKLVGPRLRKHIGL
jgi:serine/alanine adding enzyme